MRLSVRGNGTMFGMRANNTQRNQGVWGVPGATGRSAGVAVADKGCHHLHVPGGGGGKIKGHRGRLRSGRIVGHVGVGRRSRDLETRRRVRRFVGNRDAVLRHVDDGRKGRSSCQGQVQASPVTFDPTQTPPVMPSVTPQFRPPSPPSFNCRRIPGPGGKRFRR